MKLNTEEWFGSSFRTIHDGDFEHVEPLLIPNAARSLMSEGYWQCQIVCDSWRNRDNGLLLAGGCGDNQLQE